jgi:uncharacterized membrane protein YfcA
MLEGMSAKKRRCRWRWLALLAPPAAVGAQIAAGYPDPPNLSQAIWFLLAIIFTVLGLGNPPLAEHMPELDAEEKKTSLKSIS